MRRREFLAGFGTAVASPAFSQPTRVRRIGFLEGGNAAAQNLAAFKEGLSKLGWIENDNFVVESRAARGADPGPIAAELVALRPDVIVSSTTPALRALQHATSTTPIIFVVVSDPVGDGFVATLRRPGRNITGFSNYDPGMSGKWIELLREAAPHVRRVAILFNPATAPHSIFLGPLLSSALAFGLAPHEARVGTDEDIETVLAAFGAEPGGGVIAMPDGFIGARAALLASAAARHRLPALFPFRFYATSGGLISYGANILDQYKQAASYVDRIFKGESAAELPVQGPTNFELVLNVRAAREIGLDLSPTLLARADEVIE